MPFLWVHSIFIIHPKTKNVNLNDMHEEANMQNNDFSEGQAKSES